MPLESPSNLPIAVPPRAKALTAVFSWQTDAVGGAGEEGILGDLRAAYSGGVWVEVGDLAVAVGAADLAGHAQLLVEVVAGVGPEGDLAVLLGELAAAEAQVSAAAGDLPAVGVGLGDLPRDAGPAICVGLAARVARGLRLSGETRQCGGDECCCCQSFGAYS